MAMAAIRLTAGEDVSPNSKGKADLSRGGSGTNSAKEGGSKESGAGLTVRRERAKSQVRDCAGPNRLFHSSSHLLGHCSWSGSGDLRRGL